MTTKSVEKDGDIDNENDELGSIKDNENKNENVKFTVVDLLRMVSGLILFIAILSKLFTDNWLFFNLHDFDQDRSSSQIPAYWLKRYDEIPIAFNLIDLESYKGIKNKERILLSVKGDVFDVTGSPSFYGKNGAYEKFTGTDCSNIFCQPIWDFTSLKDECDFVLKDISESQLQRLDSWLSFFEKKYPKIGYVQEIKDSQQNSILEKIKNKF